MLLCATIELTLKSPLSPIANYSSVNGPIFYGRFGIIMPGTEIRRRDAKPLRNVSLARQIWVSPDQRRVSAGGSAAGEASATVRVLRFLPSESKVICLWHPRLVP